MERRLDLFRRAAAFRGRSRERMAAIGAACGAVFPNSIPTISTSSMSIRITSVREKTSEQRRLCLETCEASCSEIVRGVIPRRGGGGRFGASGRIRRRAIGLWSVVDHVRRILDRRHEPLAGESGNSRPDPGHSGQLQPPARRRRLEAAEYGVGYVCGRRPRAARGLCRRNSRNWRSAAPEFFCPQFDKSSFIDSTL